MKTIMNKRFIFLFILLSLVLFSCKNPHNAFMGHWQQIIEYDDSTVFGQELFISASKIWIIDADEEPDTRTYRIIQKNNKEFLLFIEIINENHQAFKRHISFSDDHEEMRIEWSEITSYSQLYGLEKYKRIDSKKYPDIAK
ncbi:MAG: hypothetical protein JSV22_04585 [Bacteroidales bacterium]|nr:MAG: hypothetical protein JSV22_04585 [Bacteroidales bacterium]